MNITTFLILQFTVLIYSLSSVFSKYASREAFLSFRYILFTGLIIFCLGIYAILWQQILKKVKLTAAFANKGITIIWNMMLGYLIFAEKVTLKNMIGALVVLIGIVVVTIKGEQNE